jgi:hypothetical protein
MTFLLIMVDPAPVVESFTQGFGLTLLIVLGCALLAVTVGVVRRMLDV